jgi:uncharacterized glyoxalase superfamily protein PhnB
MPKNPKPENMPWLTPYLASSDPEALIGFYEKAFGFKLRSKVHMDEEKTMMHVEMEYEDQMIMFGSEACYENNTKTPNNSGIPCPTVIYLYVDDVDAFYENALKHKARSTKELQDTPWGDRMCNLEDPEGYIWAFATNTAPCPNA